ncbi:ribonuclease D [Nocardioides sp.]|uniref:ribonuclease D n=1 Tax=Nocardioides sp. TaxID=35761 RepID=UPI0035142E5A
MTSAPASPSEPAPDLPDDVETPRELLVLRDGLPELTDTPEALARVCELLAAGTGPVAIDAERASGYRYSNRAYLVQLRRTGSGTALVDPIAFDSLAPLQEVLAGTEWILHAATQDLPCLAEVGLRPTALFDTELAGRLLGYPRVGLATLVEEKLGFRLRKEHSAADWSTRPLPASWLEYAALDVEVLVELREVLAAELVAAGKDGWAAEEFAALCDFAPAPRAEAWRRVSGMHRIRGRRSLGAVKALWEARDEIAATRDVSPSRIVPDSALVAAATALPEDRAALMETKGFHGRGASRYASRFVAAITEVLALPEDDLPARAPRGDGPPAPRAWAEKDPVAAERLRLAREAMTALSEEHGMPVENLLTPDTLRRALWNPPRTREPAALHDAVVTQLTTQGARAWQAALTAPLVVEAVLAADAAAAAAAAERAAATAEGGDPEATEATEA